MYYSTQNHQNNHILEYACRDIASFLRLLYSRYFDSQLIAFSEDLNINIIVNVIFYYN